MLISASWLLAVRHLLGFLLLRMAYGSINVHQMQRPHSFKLSLFAPMRDERKLMLVQCAGCGTPIGAIAQCSTISSRLAPALRTTGAG